MSGPYDPNQQWSSGQPGQEPSPSEPTQHAGWQPPAYSPQQYPQGQPYSPTEQGAAGQPTQYGQQPYSPTEQAAAAQPTQYGQPQQYQAPQAPQYGQQYPATEGYGQPGQYPGAGAQYGEAPAAFGDAGAEKGSKSSLAVLGAVIGVLAAIIVAVVLVMGFWKPGFFVTTKLDVNKAQQGVKDILTNQTTGYGVDNVSDVKCNGGKNPTVKKGDTFTCDASVDGTHKQVTVTFQDNNGTYEVGRPK
ncbi:DUF4333 domain-containing protein [Mycobacterium sp.]|uniref:DUF4333 domain-containing protein n=1 Tax=Mycobacterium sp. TaxID=1785 RepID=UPI003C706C87